MVFTRVWRQAPERAAWPHFLKKNTSRRQPIFCNRIAPFFFVALRGMVLRLIFALYIFSLAVMPCADDAVDETTREVVVEPWVGHQVEDLCAPFCICSCCASHIQLNYVAEIDCSLNNYDTKFITPYPVNVAIHRTSNIWQPPRVSGSFSFII